VVKELLVVFFRWKRDIAIVFGLIVLFSIIFAFSSQPIYESSANVLILPGRDKKPFLPDQYTANSPSYVQVSAEDIADEIKIMTSYPVLKSVVEHLGLEKESKASKRKGISVVTGGVNDAVTGVLEIFGLKTRIPANEAAVNRLRNQIFINFVTRANVISVRCRDVTPQDATIKVNAVVEAYIAHHLKVFSNSGAATAIKYIGDEYNVKLKQMEDSLQTFKTRYNIVDAESEYQDIQKKLLEAKSKLLLLKRLDPEQIKASDLANVSDDPTFAQLQTKLTEADLNYIELSTRYGKDEGKVVAASNEIKEIKRFVGQRIYISIENWQQLMRKYQERFSELEQRKLVVDQLDREIANLKGVYELSSQKSNEVLINSVMDNASVTSVRVIENGHDSMVPVFPRKTRIIALSLIFGFLAAAGYGFFRNAISTHMFTVADVEALTRKPVVASVPDFSPSMNGNLYSASSRNLIPVVNLIDAAPVPCVAFFIAPSMEAGTSYIATSVTALVASRAANKVLRIDICSDSGRLAKSGRKLSMNAKPTPEAIKEKIVPAFQTKSDMLEIALPSTGLPEQKDIDAIFSILKDFGYTHIFLDMSMHRADPLYISFAKYASLIFPVVAYNKTKRFALLRLINNLTHHGHGVNGCVFNRRKNEIPELIYQWL